jgi:hypothetical protein
VVAAVIGAGARTAAIGVIAATVVRANKVFEERLP